jgi:hypothetical protein
LAPCRRRKEEKISQRQAEADSKNENKLEEDNIDGEDWRSDEEESEDEDDSSAVSSSSSFASSPSPVLVLRSISSRKQDADEISKALAKRCRGDFCLSSVAPADAAMIRQQYWSIPSREVRTNWIMERKTPSHRPAIFSHVCNEGWQTLVGFSVDKQTHARKFLKDADGDIAASRASLRKSVEKLSFARSFNDPVSAEINGWLIAVCCFLYLFLCSSRFYLSVNSGEVSTRLSSSTITAGISMSAWIGNSTKRFCDCWVYIYICCFRLGEAH